MLPLALFLIVIMVFKDSNISYYCNKQAWLYYSRMMKTEFLSYIKHSLEASMKMILIVSLLSILLHWIIGQTFSFNFLNKINVFEN